MNNESPENTVQTPEVVIRKAKVWSPGQTYRVDALVDYNGKIYVVARPHTSSEDETPDKSTEIYMPR